MRLRKCLIGCSILLCLLTALSGCKKEAAAKPAARTEPEQTAAGVAVRIPSTQYRLTRTEPEGAGYGSISCRMPEELCWCGETFTQEETENG